MSNEIEKFTDQDAKDLDAAIRSLARTVHIALDALVLLVGQAETNQIHLALGFPTWSAYLADALDGQWKIEKDRRGEAIKFLAEKGVSQRQITKITGASKGTIHRELHGAPLGHLLDVAMTAPAADATWVAEQVAEFQALGGTFTVPADIDAAMKRLTELDEDQRRLERYMLAVTMDGATAREITDRMGGLLARLNAASPGMGNFVLGLVSENLARIDDEADE